MQIVLPSAIPIVAVLAIGVVLAGLPSFTDRYVQLLGFRIFELAALAQAWNLLAGYTGLVSLGSAAFIGLGAYTAAELTNLTAIPIVPAMILGGVVAAAFAAAVSTPMFRLRGIYFSIGTLTLAEALRIWMVNWNALGGSRGIYLTVPAPSADQLYFLSLAVMVGASAILLAVLRAPLGLSLRGVRDNEDVARQMGVGTFWTKFWALGISAFLMGIVGGMQAARLSVIEPYGSFGLQWTIDIVTIAIIGGRGTIVGPLLGAGFIVVLGELLADYPEIHVALSGVILILVIRFAPSGLWGSLLRPALMKATGSAI